MEYTETKHPNLTHLKQGDVRGEKTEHKPPSQEPVNHSSTNNMHSRYIAFKEVRA